MILKSSLTYFVGADMDAIHRIPEAMRDIYEAFLAPPYTDEFAVDGRTIAWLEPDFPKLKSRFEGRETTEEYARAVMAAMVDAGVPERALHVYRQTLTLEEL